MEERPEERERGTLLGVEEGTVSEKALSVRLVLKEGEKAIWGWSVVSREVSEEGNTSMRRTRT